MKSPLKRGNSKDGGATWHPVSPSDGTGWPDSFQKILNDVHDSRCDANESLKERVFSAVVVDEGGPLGVGVQRLASNQAVLL
jgi:hypothetical protein